MEVVAIASKTEINAQQTAQKFNIPSVYTDYVNSWKGKTWMRSTSAFPPLHEEMIHEAAEAGKHIICEKP